MGYLLILIAIKSQISFFFLQMPIALINI